jgi:hypothetical protein
MAYLKPAYNSSDYDELCKRSSLNLRYYTTESLSTPAVAGYPGGHKHSMWWSCCDDRHDKRDTCSIYLKHCAESLKTLIKVSGLRAKISTRVLLNMIHDTILNLGTGRKWQISIKCQFRSTWVNASFSAHFQYRKNYYKACLITELINKQWEKQKPSYTSFLCLLHEDSLQLLLITSFA